MTNMRKLIITTILLFVLGQGGPLWASSRLESFSASATVRKQNCQGFYPCPIEWKREDAETVARIEAAAKFAASRSLRVISSAAIWNRTVDSHRIVTRGDTGKLYFLDVNIHWIDTNRVTATLTVSPDRWRYNDDRICYSEWAPVTEDQNEEDAAEVARILIAGRIAEVLVGAYIEVEKETVNRQLIRSQSKITTEGYIPPIEIVRTQNRGSGISVVGCANRHDFWE